MAAVFVSMGISGGAGIGVAAVLARYAHRRWAGCGAAVATAAT